MPANTTMSNQSPIPNIHLLAELLLHHYGTQMISFHRLQSDTGKHIYRVEQANGERWVLRLSPLTSNDKTLLELTNLLTFLEDQNYPAERIIQTMEHTAISTAAGWRFLMTTFLRGERLDYAPSTLSLLGAMLGQLHALKTSTSAPLPKAEMLPARELAYARRRLTSVASLVPQQLISRYEQLENALSSIDYCEDLPTVLIHNDCHPANALLTAPGQVTLLDWEGAGMGPAIIDVGFLLSNCDGEAPWTPRVSSRSFQIDEARLKAVVEGYSQHHQLTAKELDRLPDAIRFRSIVFGACNFVAAIAEHGGPETPLWWWARYMAAEEIADRVRKYIESPQK